MFNPAFDLLLEMGTRARLPLTVACHRPSDRRLFTANQRLEERVRGFGWSDNVADRCTALRHFRTPTGLDAVLFYQHPEEAGCPTRQVALLTFTCGQVVDRLALVGWHMTNHAEREALDLYATTTSTIDARGRIESHHASNWTREVVERRLIYELLETGRIWRRLARARVKRRGTALSFSAAELAQVEARVNQQDRGAGINEVLAAARSKYGKADVAVQRLVAGTLGIAPAEVKAAIEWREGYARMRDGGYADR